MIISKQNPKIQQVRALLALRKERYAQNAFVLEGVRLIEEAMQSGARPKVLLYSEPNARAESLIGLARNSNADVDEVDPRLLSSISDTQTPQGLLAVFPMHSLPFPSGLNFVLILDSISEPGNLGAILRTASAAGVQLVILAPGTTDPYSPKVLRAAMGAHFYLPILGMEWSEIQNLTKQSREPLQVFISDVSGGQSCWDTDLRSPLAIVIGSEAAGVSRSADSLTNQRIHIPMQGKIESLNASIAASILIFEVLRQRRS